MKSSNISWFICCTCASCESASRPTYNHIRDAVVSHDTWGWKLRESVRDILRGKLCTFVCTDTLCIIPVCVRSDLCDHWLCPLKEFIHIGHVEEEKLHVDRRGRSFPGLKHTAALYQNNFLLRCKVCISSNPNIVQSDTLIWSWKEKIQFQSNEETLPRHVLNLKILLLEL